METNLNSPLQYESKECNTNFNAICHEHKIGDTITLKTIFITNMILISAGLKPVVSHSEKSCIVSY